MIRLEKLTKVFDTPQGPVTATDHVSLEVKKGEICVLLGPSGCGKTTTMKMVNRLIEPTSGKIFIDGKDTDSVDAITLRRSIGYVIQQIGLFPNKTIVDNICTVPDLLGWDRRKSRTRAAELLEMVALEPRVFLDRYPRELSGGQQQRIGVIRALAADPPVMLMDEPFGAIDPINREVIQDEFLSLQRKLQTTVMFVSHDLDEAVKMADRIAIFRNGRLEQFATPRELLAAPSNPFVTDFLGSDRALKRLRLVTVAEAMRQGVGAIAHDASMAEARAAFSATPLPALVMTGPRGRARGILAADVAQAEGSVADHSFPVTATASVDADLRGAVAAMFAHNLPVLPCVDNDGILRGVLTFQSVTRALQNSGERE